MQVSRAQDGNQVLCLLTVDSAVPQAVLDSVRDAIDASTAREVDLEG